MRARCIARGKVGQLIFPWSRNRRELLPFFRSPFDSPLPTCPEREGRGSVPMTSVTFPFNYLERAERVNRKRRNRESAWRGEGRLVIISYDNLNWPSRITRARINLDFRTSPPSPSRFRRGYRDRSFFRCKSRSLGTFQAAGASLLAPSIEARD